MKRQMILTLYLILEIIFFMFRINQEYYTIQLYPILIVIINWGEKIYEIIRRR